VRIVALGPIGRGVEIDAWGSHGVTLGPLARLAEGAVGRTGGGVGPTTVALARIAPGGVLGRHPAATWQVYAVVVGQGWVAGADGVRMPVGEGEAAVWEPGEAHESGSDTGMTVCIVEAAVDPVAGLL
jgi:quercetin dioxygenase-like cupin family protein